MRFTIQRNRATFRETYYLGKNNVRIIQLILWLKNQFEVAISRETQSTASLLIVLPGL